MFSKKRYIRVQQHSDYIVNIWTKFKHAIGFQIKIMGNKARKYVFGVSDKVRFKPAG